MFLEVQDGNKQCRVISICISRLWSIRFEFTCLEENLGSGTHLEMHVTSLHFVLQYVAQAVETGAGIAKEAIA